LWQFDSPRLAYYGSKKKEGGQNQESEDEGVLVLQLGVVVRTVVIVAKVQLSQRGSTLKRLLEHG
jgi:hypothetical protein